MTNTMRRNVLPCLMIAVGLGLFRLLTQPAITRLPDKPSQNLQHLVTTRALGRDCGPRQERASCRFKSNPGFQRQASSIPRHSKSWHWDFGG